MRLSIKAVNLDKVQAFIQNVKWGFKGVGMEAINEYMFNEIGRATPPYSYVTRAEAYGQTFVSDRQRRYVMAVITPGQSQRTGAIENAWQMSSSGGTRQTIYNTNPASVWVYGNNKQANLNALVGWPKVNAFLAANIEAALGYTKNKIAGWLNSGASGEAPGL